MTILSMHPGTVGLLIFFVFFITVLIWVYRPGSKSEYDRTANIPLSEDN